MEVVVLSIADNDQSTNGVIERCERVSPYALESKFSLRADIRIALGLSPKYFC